MVMPCDNCILESTMLPMFSTFCGVAPVAVMIFACALPVLGALVREREGTSIVVCGASLPMSSTFRSVAPCLMMPFFGTSWNRATPISGGKITRASSVRSLAAGLPATSSKDLRPIEALLRVAKVSIRGAKDILPMAGTPHPGSHYRTDGALSAGYVFGDTVPMISCARNTVRHTRPIAPSMR